jgi:hypothetical protein
VGAAANTLRPEPPASTAKSAGTEQQAGAIGAERAKP